MFLLPQSWYDKVTAVTDTLTGDIVFCRYDGEMNDHMTELLRYSVAQDTESQEERDTEGYQLLHTRRNRRPAGTAVAEPHGAVPVRAVNGGSVTAGRFWYGSDFTEDPIHSPDQTQTEV